MARTYGIRIRIIMPKVRNSRAFSETKRLFTVEATKAKKFSPLTKVFGAEETTMLLKGTSREKLPEAQFIPINVDRISLERGERMDVILMLLSEDRS
jgi:hypothetical protein